MKSLTLYSSLPCASIHYDKEDVVISYIIYFEKY